MSDELDGLKDLGIDKAFMVFARSLDECCTVMVRGHIACSQLPSRNRRRLRVVGQVGSQILQ
jgi:hypothetical protein